MSELLEHPTPLHNYPHLPNRPTSTNGKKILGGQFLALFGVKLLLVYVVVGWIIFVSKKYLDGQKIFTIVYIFSVGGDERRSGSWPICTSGSGPSVPRDGH